MLKNLKLREIGRKMFNPFNAHPLPRHKIEIWPGFSSSLNINDGGIMLNVDVSHRVLRVDTALETIESIRNNSRDFKTEVNEALINCTVMTHYNKNTYQVHEIDFDKSPEDTFEWTDRSTKETK